MMGSVHRKRGGFLSPAENKCLRVLVLSELLIVVLNALFILFSILQKV